ncbi:MAG: AAA family ATPase [Anaerolineae bacterium]|nr:AAA family ATPase [Anaerolineae bacterium]
MMLIRFSVENFLSFCDETEFSMIAGKTRQHSEQKLKLKKPNNLNVLKTGVIYGANTSGKSNLVKAIDYARDRIIMGTRLKQMIPFNPFRFAKDCQSKPSKFTFEFSTNDESYVYGFSLDAQRIHEEWLYEIRARSERQIFERKTSANNETTVEFNLKFDSKDDEDFLRFTARGTRPNQLFLTESIERNVEHFADVYNWFRNSLVIIFPDSKITGLPALFMVEDSFKQRFEQLLKQFDTGISGVKLQEVDFEKLSIPEIILEDIHQNMHSIDAEEQMVVLTPDGRRYLFDRNCSGVL